MLNLFWVEMRGNSSNSRKCYGFEENKDMCFGVAIFVLRRHCRTMNLNSSQNYIFIETKMILYEKKNFGTGL